MFNPNKEKKNIVADPTLTAVVGRRVNMSTIKADYQNVLVVQFDQYTMIIEVDGIHYLLSKSAIVDLEIPEDAVQDVLTHIDSALKQIEYKKTAKKQVPQSKGPDIKFKKTRTFVQKH